MCESPGTKFSRSENRAADRFIVYDSDSVSNKGRVSGFNARAPASVDALVAVLNSLQLIGSEHNLKVDFACDQPFGC